jgi:hypothetical protein
MEHVVNTRFYNFRQNNSGGYWVDEHSKGIGRNVIIEALSEDDAISRAENIGLYFDGRYDCPCCGNRWSSYIEGEEYPEIYGVKMVPCEEETESFIHHFDGSFSYAKEFVEED